MKGHNIYGIDFVGGDEVALTYTERQSTADVRAALEGGGIGEANPLYQSDLAGENETLKVSSPRQRGQ